MSIHDPYYPGDSLIDAANRSIDLAAEVERLRAVLSDVADDCGFDHRNGVVTLSTGVASRLAEFRTPVDNGHAETPGSSAQNGRQPSGGDQ